MARIKNQGKGPVAKHLAKKLNSKVTSFKSGSSNQNDQSTADGGDSRVSRASYSSRRAADSHSSSSRSPPRTARKSISTSNSSPKQHTSRKTLTTANQSSHTSSGSASTSDQTSRNISYPSTSHAARKSIISSNQSPQHAARKSISSNWTPPHAARKSISSNWTHPHAARKSLVNQEAPLRHEARKRISNANASFESSDTDSDAELLRVPPKKYSNRKTESSDSDSDADLSKVSPKKHSNRKTLRLSTDEEKENSSGEKAPSPGAKTSGVNRGTSSVPSRKAPATVRKLFRKSGYHMRPFSVHITDYRRKPGVVALQQIRFYQKHTGLLIPRMVFQRVVREVLLQFGSDYRIQSEALLALQESAEAHLVHLFETGQLCAIHAKRVTLMNRDFNLIKSIDK